MTRQKKAPPDATNVLPFRTGGRHLDRRAVRNALIKEAAMLLRMASEMDEADGGGKAPVIPLRPIRRKPRPDPEAAE